MAAGTPSWTMLNSVPPGNTAEQRVKSNGSRLPINIDKGFSWVPDSILLMTADRRSEWRARAAGTAASGRLALYASSFLGQWSGRRRLERAGAAWCMWPAAELARLK